YAKLTERVAYNSATNSGRLLVPLILRTRHDAKLDSRAAMEEFQRQSEEQWSEALSKYKFKFIKPHSGNPTSKPEPDEVAILATFLHDPKKTEEGRQQAS